MFLRNCSKNRLRQSISFMQIAFKNRLQNTNHVRQFSRTDCLAVAKRDFYAELKVPRSALQSEIKKSYAALSQVYQAQLDSGAKDAADKLKRLNEAYYVLSHIDQKRLYDKGLTQFLKGAPAATAVTAKERENQSYVGPSEHNPVEYAEKELNVYLQKHIGTRPLEEWRIEGSEKASIVERLKQPQDLQAMEYLVYFVIALVFAGSLWSLYEKEAYIKQSKK